MDWEDFGGSSCCNCRLDGAVPGDELDGHDVVRAKFGGDNKVDDYD